MAEGADKTTLAVVVIAMMMCRLCVNPARSKVIIEDENKIIRRKVTRWPALPLLHLGWEYTSKYSTHTLHSRHS